MYKSSPTKAEPISKICSFRPLQTGNASVNEHYPYHINSLKKCQSTKTHWHFTCTCRSLYLQQLTNEWVSHFQKYCFVYTIHIHTHILCINENLSKINPSRVPNLSHFPTFNLFISSTVINYLLGTLHEKGSIRLHENLTTWSLSSSFVELGHRV